MRHISPFVIIGERSSLFILHDFARSYGVTEDIGGANGLRCSVTPCNALSVQTGQADACPKAVL